MQPTKSQPPDYALAAILGTVVGAAVTFGVTYQVTWQIHWREVHTSSGFSGNLVALQLAPIGAAIAAIAACVIVRWRNVHF